MDAERAVFQPASALLAAAVALAVLPFGGRALAGTLLAIGATVLGLSFGLHVNVLGRAARAGAAGSVALLVAFGLDLGVPSAPVAGALVESLGLLLVGGALLAIDAWGVRSRTAAGVAWILSSLAGSVAALGVLESARPLAIACDVVGAAALLYWAFLDR